MKASSTAPTPNSTKAVSAILLASAVLVLAAAFPKKPVMAAAVDPQFWRTEGGLKAEVAVKSMRQWFTDVLVQSYVDSEGSRARLVSECFSSEEILVVSEREIPLVGFAWAGREMKNRAGIGKRKKFVMSEVSGKDLIVCWFICGV